MFQKYSVHWHFLYSCRTESDGFECRRMPTTRQTSSDRRRVRVGMWSVPKRSYFLSETKLRLIIRILLYCCNICMILLTETLLGPHVFLPLYCSAVVIGRRPQILRPLLFRVTYTPKQKQIKILRRRSVFRDKPNVTRAYKYIHSHIIVTNVRRNEFLILSKNRNRLVLFYVLTLCGPRRVLVFYRASVGYA